MSDTCKSVVARELAATSQHGSAAPSGASQDQKLISAAAHGFFGIIQKIAKRTQHVYARCQDGSLDEEQTIHLQISSFGGKSLGVREQTNSAACPRRPEVASTGSDAAPASQPPAPPTAPGSGRKSAAEGAAPPHPPEWMRRRRRPSRPAAPSFRWKRPSPRRGP